ncbi:MAG: hypothetical protein ACPLRW_13535, partial [Moorellales bacterium]
AFVRQVFFWPSLEQEVVRVVLPIWVSIFFAVRAVAAVITKTSIRVVWRSVGGFFAIFFPVIVVLSWPVAVWEKSLFIVCWLVLALTLGVRLLDL